MSNMTKKLGLELFIAFLLTKVVGVLVFWAWISKKLGGDMAAKLEEEFTVKELFAAFSDLNRDKGPCSDGFSFRLLVFQLEFHGEGSHWFLQGVPWPREIC